MVPRILPPAPEGSELERWTEHGRRYEPSHSNVVTFVSPDERYGLRVEVDDPIHGYLIQLFAETRDRDEPIARTVVDEEDLALQVVAKMAAAAEDLDTLVDRPSLGPETVHREDVVDGAAETPDEWEDEEEWQDALDEAFAKAEIRRAKGTLTTKEIDGREYYYLQWREGDKVKSQYVAPVSPASQ